MFNISTKLIALALVISSFAYGETYSPVIDVDYRPDISTDEGGFWYKVDQLESDVKSSPYLIRDETINAYVNDMVCRLAGDYCSSIRVYLIDNPHFNALMYPNGMMHVWSGLLLRVENDGQLAAVLGHEVAHYLRTHQIEQWRKSQSNAAASIILDIGIAAVTGIYGIATLAMSGNDASFSRKHEKEADLMGATLMAKAGYDPKEASVLWERLIEESMRDESKEETSFFWASHPRSEDRNQYLKEYSDTLLINSQAKPSNDLITLLSKHYFDLMKNHISLEEHGQTEVLLERHKKLGYPKQYIEFFYGELYRKRGKEGDQSKAQEHYLSALNHDESLSNAHKQLGYIYLKNKNNTLSLKHFESYIALEPNAKDKAMITYYIKMLGKQ